MKITFVTRSLFTTVLLLALIGNGCTEAPTKALNNVEVSINEGYQALRVFDFDQAYEHLHAALPQLRHGTTEWRRATYALALAAWHKSPPNSKNLNESKSLLNQIIESAPESEISAAALLDLGRIEELPDFRGDPTDVPSAQNYYRQVRQRFPESEMATRATLYLAQSYVHSLEPAQIQQAVDLLEPLLEQQTNPHWIGIVGQYLAHIQYAYLENYDAALAPYLAATESGLPRKSVTDLYLWELGLIAEKAKRPRIAARIFSRIVVEFPRSTYGAVARDRVAKIAEAHPDEEIPIPEVSAFRFGIPTEN